jgi:hypothetical protein
VSGAGGFPEDRWHLHSPALASEGRQYRHLERDERRDNPEQLDQIAMRESAPVGMSRAPSVVADTSLSDVLLGARPAPGLAADGLVPLQQRGRSRT